MKIMNPTRLAWIATIVSILTLSVLLCLQVDIAVAQTVILTYTLVALIWYAYWTYRISESQVKAVVVGSIRYEPDSHEVLVTIANISNSYAKTKVVLNVQVYGDDTDLGDDYCGKTIWHMTPQFRTGGHFNLEKPLKQKGKTFRQMVQEANDENATRQCRLSLKLEWEDEDGRQGSSPEHWWNFDFRTSGFIYKVGGF